MIEVDSILNKGTTFTIRFPFRPLSVASVMKIKPVEFPRKLLDNIEEISQPIINLPQRAFSLEKVIAEHSMFKKFNVAYWAFMYTGSLTLMQKIMYNYDLTNYK